MNEFIRETAIDLGQMWGIAKSVFTQILGLEDGTYVIVRDPAKRQLVVYKVNDDEFDSE